MTLYYTYIIPIATLIVGFLIGFLIKGNKKKHISDVDSKNKKKDIETLKTENAALRNQLKDIEYFKSQNRALTEEFKKLKKDYALLEKYAYAELPTPGNALDDLNTVIGSKEKVAFELPIETTKDVSEVLLIGDFNDWDTNRGIALHKSDDGTFSIYLALEKGNTYEYRYLLDGKKWINDNRESTNKSQNAFNVNNCFVSI